MALTVLPITIKDITSIKFKDATGTPLFLAVVPKDGEVSLIQGEYEQAHTGG